jgi:hypothetical protein
MRWNSVGWSFMTGAEIDLLQYLLALSAFRSLPMNEPRVTVLPHHTPSIILARPGVTELYKEGQSKGRYLTAP